MIIQIENSFYNSDNIVKVEIIIPTIKDMLYYYCELYKHTNFNDTMSVKVYEINTIKRNFNVKAKIYGNSNKFCHYFNLLNDDEILIKIVDEDIIYHKYPIIPDEELTDYLNKAIEKVHLNELKSLHKFFNN